MKRGMFLPKVVLLAFWVIPALAQWSEEELMGEDPPPPGPRLQLSGPEMFRGPNGLSLVCDSNNDPHIVISANPDFPVMPAYSIKTTDSSMLIDLRVWKGSHEYVPPNFIPPSDEFTISAVYHHCPGDTAVFVMRKSEEGSWSIEPIVETRFLVFTGPVTSER